ncbi:DUF5995 family protein [Streptomyces sp. NPDC046215]|uniref:Secreted protein n=1 Tax=Streptomyces stramineus TaxID=173861 RepID=A0ABP3KFV2_9ACTN
MRATAAAIAAAVLWTGGPAAAESPSGRAGCHQPAPACVAAAERTLAALRDRLGCDHRAPFAALYAESQGFLRESLASKPFAEPSWLAGDLNSAFVDRYLTAYEDDRAGRPVPAAWRIAFETARTGQVNAGQDALLGVNAHIQRDMPYVLAEHGLVRADGTSRKDDYDRVQAVLDRAYGPAVREIARRYDPLVALADDRWNPVAGLTAHELLVIWRQNAWEHARRLAGARSPERFRAAARDVEANAAAWARLLAAVQVPGYRLVRDAHCAGATVPRRPAPGAWAPVPLPAALSSGRPA